MRILIVEDDPSQVAILFHAFNKPGYTVMHENDGKRADHLLAVHEFDVVILDMGLPGMDGVDVLRRLRHRKNNVPVLILTARDEVQDRVLGLDMGADDYLTKPFDVSELEARVRSLIRRGHSGSGAQLQVGALSLDTVGRLATLGGQPLELSARELNVLEVLALNAGRVVSKERLSEQLSGLGDLVSDNAVEVYMHRLRKHLKAGGIHIRTMRGLGYMLEKQ
jgi:two-component system, OmpR family, response regulator